VGLGALQLALQLWTRCAAAAPWLPGPGPPALFVSWRCGLPGLLTSLPAFFALRQPGMRWGLRGLLPLLWPCCWPAIIRSAWRRRDGVAVSLGWGVGLGGGPGPAGAADPHVIEPSARAGAAESAQSRQLLHAAAPAAAQPPAVWLAWLLGLAWGWRSLVGAAPRSETLRCLAPSVFVLLTSKGPLIDQIKASAECFRMSPTPNPTPVTQRNPSVDRAALPRL